MEEFFLKCGIPINRIQYYIDISTKTDLTVESLSQFDSSKDEHIQLLVGCGYTNPIAVLAIINAQKQKGIFY